MLDRLTIRTTTTDDYDLVSSLLAASYPVLMRTVYFNDVLQAALPAMTKANPALLSSGTFYVAQIDTELAVGCGGWSFERPGSKEVESGLAHIRHFATHPEWTGKGIGRSIYELCEQRARLAGAQRFECYSSLNAEKFYGSLGFKTVARFDVSMGPDVSFPSIRMARSI